MFEHLLRGETPPQSSTCLVEHILLQYLSFVNAGDDFFCVSVTISELLSKDALRLTINVLLT